MECPGKNGSMEVVVDEGPQSVEEGGTFTTRGSLRARTGGLSMTRSMESGGRRSQAAATECGSGKTLIVRRHFPSYKKRGIWEKVSSASNTAEAGEGRSEKKEH